MEEQAEEEVQETETKSVLENLKEMIVNMDRKQLLVILFIFLLGFGVRAHLMKYELLFGFDSYFHARAVGMVIENGFLVENDPLAYPHWEGGEGGPMHNISPVFWMVTAAIYKVFTFGAAYDKEVWIIFVKLLPAIFGGLIAVALYFMMKEMYGRKAGYVAAFFAALVPSFVYRTMSGFFEEDAIGFLWMILGFYFFVKAIKQPALSRESIKNIIISSIFFGIFAWTWEMFLMVPMIIIAYFIFTMIIMWISGAETKQLKSFAALVILSFVIFGGIATVKDNGLWVERMGTYVAQYLPVTEENIERAQSKGPGILAQTVGEENLGVTFWGVKYNALVFFAYLAIILIFYKMFRTMVKKENKDWVSLILLFWVIIAMYMAWSKLKFTYVFGLPIAASAGFVFSEVLNFVKERTDLEKKTIMIAMAFMLLVGVGAGTWFVTEKYPNIEMNNGWKPAMKWMNENTPEDAIFFNWWDEGHWITFVAERIVIEDNRNLSWEADQDTARFILSEDENTAHSLTQIYNADYVILSEDMLSKLHSFGIYAYKTLDFSDPRIIKYLIPQGKPPQQIPCSRSVDSLNGAVRYQCGNQGWSEQEMNSIPAQWQSSTNILIQERYPFFLYRSEDNTRIYLLNSAENGTTLARLWFSDPGITLFDEVYSHPGGVKIFKVN